MKKSTLITGMMAIAIFASLAGSTYAATPDNTNTQGGQFRNGAGQGNFQRQPGVSGTVSAISGSTLTLLGRDGTTTYTIDASNAKVSKLGTPATAGTQPTSTTIAVSDILVGDSLRVQGTVSGNSVTATQIMDGKFGGNGNPQGQPGVSGTVTAISGSTLTVQGKSVTYTIDASNAKVNKITSAAVGTKPTTTPIAVSDILVGDNVRVQGTVSGNSVTATQIMDGKFGGNGMGNGFGVGNGKNGKPQGGVNGQISTITGAATSAACLKTEKTTNAANVKSAKDTYTAATKDAKTTYNAATKSAKDTYTAATKDAKTAYNAAVTAAKAGDKTAYSAAVKTAKTTYNAALKSAKDTYNAALKSAKDTYNAALKSAKDTYNAALKDAKTAYNATLATEKTRDAAAKTACKQ
jgi:hypothetical protein